MNVCVWEGGVGVLVEEVLSNGCVMGQLLGTVAL